MCTKSGRALKVLIFSLSTTTADMAAAKAIIVQLFRQRLSKTGRLAASCYSPSIATKNLVPAQVENGLFPQMELAPTQAAGIQMAHRVQILDLQLGSCPKYRRKKRLFVDVTKISTSGRPGIAQGVMERAVVGAMRAIEQLPARISAALRPYAPLWVSGAFDRVHIDSPLILCFLLFCLIVQIITVSFRKDFNIDYFAIWPFSRFYLFSLLSYWRLFSHVLGHSSWEHFSGNAIYILLVGPACEREYGAYNLLQIMLWTGLSSAFSFMMISGGNSVQLGASGVVFMLIILSSLSENRAGKVPFTFIVQIVVWVYKEVVAGIFAQDSISHSAHLVGAIVGTIAGYELHGVLVHKRAAPAMMSWYHRAKGHVSR
jgi:rhomboid protease GluP